MKFIEYSFSFISIFIRKKHSFPPQMDIEAPSDTDSFAFDCICQSSSPNLHSADHSSNQ